MFGDLAFEMLRSFNKKHFKLQEHIARLFESARYLRIDITYTQEEIAKAVFDLCISCKGAFKQNDELRILINCSRGVLPSYISGGFNDSGCTNIIISVFPLRWSTAGLGKFYDEGVESFITSQRTIPADLLEPKVKSRSRIHYKFAYLEAEERGRGEWPIMLDPDGHVAEGPGYNVFMVKDGAVFTPEGRNVLRGISRRYIWELCENLGVPFLEKNLSVFDLVQADELFVTATPFCILPVTKLNGQKIGKGLTEYDIYGTLLSEWNRWCNSDIAGQIKGWDKERE